MATIFAKTALLPDGWQSDVLISIDENGNISAVNNNITPKENTEHIDIIVPGMPNTHSHAFQRGMAGITERITGERNSFWTWRETMYRFVKQLTPENMQAIAAQLYIEMLKAGYTSVGEFHYMHHQPDGKPYNDATEMSRILIDTALDVGIGITHLPVLYMSSCFGEITTNDQQKRFLNTPDEFIDIFESLQSTYQNNPQVKIGMAYHSLRAVPAYIIKGTVYTAVNVPIHIHVAEQMDEVNLCLEHHGKRPVEYLLDTVNVNQNWNLVHATHMNQNEINMLTKTNAIVGLCPTTEANLGDGIFPLSSYLKEGGQFSIGSDSHISVNMAEELRWLEYGQRLFHQTRAVTLEDNCPSVGLALYNKALTGGVQSLGRPTGKIATGMRADFLVLDSSHPTLIAQKRECILDGFVFATSSTPISDVMVGGHWVIRNYRHKKEDNVLNNYKNALLTIL